MSFGNLRKDRLAAISAWLRKEREFSFYGDMDFIRTEEYSRVFHECARSHNRAARLTFVPTDVIQYGWGVRYMAPL
jgi:hypothetical protein